MTGTAQTASTAATVRPRPDRRGSSARVRSRAAARDIQLWLAVPQAGSVRRVLQLTGVGRLMPVYPSLQEAMSAA